MLELLDYPVALVRRHYGFNLGVDVLWEHEEALRQSSYLLVFAEGHADWPGTGLVGALADEVDLADRRPSLLDPLDPLVDFPEKRLVASGLELSLVGIVG
jgi:hypothetical protein